MAGFDGDPGADFDGGMGSEEGGLKGEEIVAEVLAGVGDDREPGGGIEEFYAEHDSDGNGAG
jgi:hypothetical protein